MEIVRHPRKHLYLLWFRLKLLWHHLKKLWILQHHLELSLRPMIQFLLHQLHLKSSSMQAQHGYGRSPKIWGVCLELRLLPKIDLKKCDGNIAKWPSFWDASELFVHHSTRLSPLKLRFGNKHLIINRHMETFNTNRNSRKSGLNGTYNHSS